MDCWHHSAADPEGLLTPDEMQAVDRAAIRSGTPSILLMERAGRAVADRAAALLDERASRQGEGIVVLCGPGNNGGDGYVAARLLAAEGHDVRIIQTAPVADSASDAATACLAWQGRVTGLNDVGTEADPGAMLGHPALIIDAIYGAGLSRNVDGRVGRLIEAAAATNTLRLAVDMPSGLDGATGQARGCTFKADATVTFHKRKPGHLLLPGRELCGDVQVIDIGIPEDANHAVDIGLWRNSPALFGDAAQPPSSDAHKYARGLALCVSGGPWQTGAIRLGAAAALRAGAGVVKIVSPKSAMPIHAGHLTAIMLTEASNAKELETTLGAKRISAVLFGPGGGTDRYAKVRLGAVLQCTSPIVLDADAITLLAADPESACARLKARRPATILTPHQGEFERLFADLSRDPRGRYEPTPSKVDRARAAAARAGCVIVYKGPDTVVAAPDGRAVINDHATAWLATAGSGDVLAGLITGLVAAGAPAFEAACAGVWLHGEAALQHGPGLIAGDLLTNIPQALAALDAARSIDAAPTPEGG